MNNVIGLFPESFATITTPQREYGAAAGMPN
jgi:hypothetical protein